MYNEDLKAMAKRIVTKIGDVFCVEIGNEYKCFFQYIDYQDKDMMKRLEQTLSIKAMFYHFIPILAGFFEKLTGNY